MNFEKEARVVAQASFHDVRDYDDWSLAVETLTKHIAEFANLIYERGRNDQAEEDAKIAIDHQESGKYTSTCCLKRKCPKTIAAAIREGRSGK